MLMEFKSISAFSLHSMRLLNFTLGMLLNTANGIGLLITVCYCSWKSSWDLNELMRVQSYFVFIFQRFQLLVSGGGSIVLLDFSFQFQCLSESRKLSKRQYNRICFIM